MCYKVSRTAMAQIITATAPAGKREVQGSGDALGENLMKCQCKGTKGRKEIFHNKTVRRRFKGQFLDAGK